MSYQWDNKKPTAQMLGRWQPFHDGHYALFEEIIKKTGQVCIQIRDVQGVDDNPFDFETVKKKIEERLNPKYEGRFKIILVSTLIIVTIVSAPIISQEGNVRFKHALEWDYFFGVIFFYFLTFLMWKKRA